MNLPSPASFAAARTPAGNKSLPSRMVLENVAAVARSVVAKRRKRALARDSRFTSRLGRADAEGNARNRGDRESGV